MNSFDLPSLFLEFLAKSAGVIAFGFLLQLLIRKFAPETKHSFWVYIFSACLGIPLLLFAFPRWEIVPGFNDSVPASLAIDPVAASPAFESSPTEMVMSTEAEPISSAPVFQISWPWIITGLWGIGVLVVLLRSAVAGLYLRGILRSSKRVDSGIESNFQKIKESLGIRHPVRLLVSPLVETPFTWGITRTRIALPKSITSWSPDDLEMMFIHELEHIRRRDAQVVLVSRIFLALNWLNPFAWMATRQAVQLREEACDQGVLRLGFSSERYAEMLFRQAKYSTSPFLQTCTTAVAETGTIEKRIKMILNKPAQPAREKFKMLSRFTGGLIISATIVIGISGCSNDDPKSDTSSGQKQVSDQQAETKSPDSESVPGGEKAITIPSLGVGAIGNKLKSITIPSIEFADTPLKDALAFLQQRSVELDTTTEVVEEKGFNIVGDLGEAENTRITLRLKNVPIAEALRYTTSLAQFKYSVEPHAVVISPITSPPVEVKGKPVFAEEKSSSSFDEAYFAKLESINLPKVEFVDTPIEDAVGFLQMRSRELDAAESDPARKGVNIVLADGKIREARLNLKLTNAPLSVVLKYVAELAGGGLRVEAAAVVIGNRRTATRPASMSDDSKSKIEANERKLAEIVIPRLEFAETPLKDALQFLQQRSVELDASESDPAGKGINVILDAGTSGKGDDTKNKTITLKLSNVPLSEAFRYTCELAGLEYKIEPHNILISPKK